MKLQSEIDDYILLHEGKCDGYECLKCFYWNFSSSTNSGCYHSKTSNYDLLKEITERKILKFKEILS